MEDKQLTPEQSFALIQQMIGQTRRKLERNSGRPFLIWGYTTAGISILNYWFNLSGFNPEWSFSWFLIPIIGFLLTRLFPAKKSTEPRTDIDRIVGAVWATSTLALIPIFIFCLFHGWSYRPSLLGLIALIMSIATVATGLIVRLRLYTIAGVAGMALCTLFSFYDFYLKKIAATQAIDAHLLNNEILIFAAIFLVTMVIPGHILNYKTNRPCSKS